MLPFKVEVGRELVQGPALPVLVYIHGGCWFLNGVPFLPLVGSRLAPSRRMLRTASWNTACAISICKLYRFCQMSEGSLDTLLVLLDIHQGHDCQAFCERSSALPLSSIIAGAFHVAHA